MSIVRMKKLRLIALRDQRDELTRALMRLGCVQVREPEGLLSQEAAAAVLRPEKAGLAAGRTKLTVLRNAVKVLAQYAPEKKKFLSARPVVSQREFLDDEALAGDLALAEQINEWDGAVRRIQAEESRLRGEIDTLRPWEPLDAPLVGVGTKRTVLLYMTAPLDVEEAAVADAAGVITEAVQIIRVSEDDRQRYFALLALREEVPSLLETLRKAGCAQAQFMDRKGTARENIRQLEAELKILDGQKRDTIRLIEAEGDKAPDIRLSTDRMTAEVSRLEAVERLSGTDSIVAMEGWCPEPDVEALEKILSEFDCAWELLEPAEEEYPDVPVKLQNNGFAEPMNLVTEMYSLPAYDGIDPNPLMAPFFVLFYGIMMADMGYGLLMMLASWIVLKKMRPRGGTKYLITLLGYSGVSTFFFGALTGGFFGDLLPQIAKMVNPDTAFTALPALFTPLEDPTMILIAALVIGVIQIFTGMIVSVRYKCKNGEGLSALFDEGAWWLILIGVALMALGIGSIGGVPVVLVIGAVLLAVGQFVMKGSFTGGLMGLFGGIYNGVTGYFSDILSYSRLMALMLSGSVIASVFNTLGAMTGNIFAFVLIALVGNALNLALNLLGCFVHDLRLQVLEFFNRFYKDGGKPFRPLNIDTNYVEIIKEDT